MDVMMDNKLSFNEQVSQCVKKTASKINMLSRLSKKLTFETKKIIYHTLIATNIEYCSTICDTCNKNQIEQLE